MKDLGESYEKPEPMAVESNYKGDKKKSHPKLCLRDKTLEAVPGKDMPKVGTEFEAEVMLKVSGISDDEWGRTVDFAVVSMELGESESEEEDEEA